MNSSSCSFHVFMFVVFFVSLECLNPTKAASCHPDDETGLLAFKSGITNDPFGMLSTWKKGTDCCSWSHVYCTGTTRVTELYIYGDEEDEDSFTLSGTISPSLAKLQYLTVIKFSDLRNLTGSFPEFLFQLPHLQRLYLNNNRLSGPLPANIGALSSNLERFSIGRNKFTGPIPTWLSNLTRLTTLDLSDNLFTGTIPLGFANLGGLWELNLEGNRLSGTIPDFFKSFTYFGVLKLSRNRFSGKLPPSIALHARNFIFLGVGQNNLSGLIPTYLSKFKYLKTLDLSKNRFSGVVPNSLAIMFSKLKYLNLSHNLLTGPFPLLRVKKNYITYLDLSYNQFHLGTIPEWVTATFIPTFNLAKCGIKMNLTEWKPKLTDIYYYNSIDLSDNDISGSPAKLLAETTVREFRASGNKLRFDLEKLNFSIALDTLDLSRNLIFGKVPANVAKLKTLNLSGNHLCGKLPVTKFPASIFGGNDCLCGPPLAPCKA